VARDLFAGELAGVYAAADLGGGLLVKAHSITLGTMYRPASTRGAFC
jgi:hypothetical protein